jgi:hypothetical protein
MKLQTLLLKLFWSGSLNAMTDKPSFTLYNPQQGHQQLLKCWEWIKPMLMAGHRVTLKAEKENRTAAQNRYQWPLLDAFSKQLKWPVNGEFVTMSPDEWKDVLTAAFNGESVRLAMGLNGGVVMLGQRTSQFSKPKFAEWIEFLNATAAHKGVELPAGPGYEDL